MRTTREAGRVKGLWGCCLVGLLLLAAADAAQPAEPIRVAVYMQPGRKKNDTEEFRRFLTKEAGFRVTGVSPEDVRAGCLSDYDVLIVPGGSAHNQAERLGELGRAKIRKFVADGGGYVGICAGSYLAAPGRPWSLDLINAKVVDREHWDRGNGSVKIRLTPLGQKALHDRKEEEQIHYAQGPLLAPGDQKDLPRYQELAVYVTGIAKHGAPRGVMPGTTAIARTTFEKGRVLLYSPHPEFEGGPNYLLIPGVRWAAGKE
jgi:hypothetical protein